MTRSVRIYRSALLTALLLAFSLQARAQEPQSQPKNGISRKEGFSMYYEVGVGGWKDLFAGATPALSFGYRASPLVYLGGGFAVNDYVHLEEGAANISSFAVPIFVHSRLDWGNEISFFLDARVGTAVIYQNKLNIDIYAAITPGVRIALRGVCGLNFGLGYDVASPLHSIMFRFGADF